jgi:hypothetical protein
MEALQYMLNNCLGFAAAAQAPETSTEKENGWQA